MINGTFGEAFAPNKNRSSVTMYLTDLCRSNKNPTNTKRMSDE